MELLGGETAEHGRFASDIDLAGFCTGIVEKNQIIDGSITSGMTRSKRLRDRYLEVIGLN